MKKQHCLTHHSFLYVCVVLLFFICSTGAESKQYVDGNSGEEYTSLNELIQNQTSSRDMVSYIFREYLDQYGIAGLDNKDIFESFVKEQHIIFPEEDRKYIKEKFEKTQQLYFTDKAEYFSFLLVFGGGYRRYKSYNPVSRGYDDFEKNVKNFPDAYNNLALYVTDMVAMQRKYGVSEDEITFIPLQDAQNFLQAIKRRFEGSWGKHPEKAEPFLQNMQYIKTALGDEWVRFEKIMWPWVKQAEMEYLFYAIQYDLPAQDVMCLHSIYKGGEFLGFSPYMSAEARQEKGAKVIAALNRYVEPYIKELRKDYSDTELKKLFIFLMYYSVALDGYAMMGTGFSGYNAEIAVENTIGKMYKIK